MTEPCPHAETQEIIRETRVLLKKGLLKARCLSSTWSLMIVLLVNTQMNINWTLIAAIVAFYVIWVGEAIWEMKRLS